MKRIIISLIISITFSICAFAESPTWNASFSKYVAWAKINGQVYTDIVVSIVSSQEDYTTNYTLIYRIGSSFVTYPWSKVTYPWVKIKIVDRETKKKDILKKTDAFLSLYLRKRNTYSDWTTRQCYHRSYYG